LDAIMESGGSGDRMTKCPCCDYEWKLGSSDFEVLTREQMERLLNGDGE
jgi:GH25 family lysozyme M1 (1,4-beta-N-acetylmuramidase)